MVRSRGGGFTRRDAGDRVVLYLYTRTHNNNNNIVEIDDVSGSTRNIIIQQYNNNIMHTSAPRRAGADLYNSNDDNDDLGHKLYGVSSIYA